jgi:hypothetical protein
LPPTDEPDYWYWEVIVVVKKMLLTGFMCIVAAGSPLQLAIAIMIVLFNLLLVLKLAPFVDDTDDWLAFLTSLQMLITLFAALLMYSDADIKMPLLSADGSVEDRDFNSMGVLLVIVNSVGIVALVVSLITMHPKVRQCINTRENLTQSSMEKKKKKEEEEEEEEEEEVKKKEQKKKRTIGGSGGAGAKTAVVPTSDGGNEEEHDKGPSEENGRTRIKEAREWDQWE